MNTWFDIHTHHPTGDPAIMEIENLRYGQSASGKTTYTSVGLHPWFLEAATMEMAKKWLSEQAALPAVRAVGEAGLDKVCDTPWALQDAAFRYCIETSESVQKPLIIHCVRAFNEVVQIKKQLNPTQSWIIHGFNKNPETAQMLIKAGCFLSFGAALFQPGNHSAEALQQTPEGSFFLETDDASEPGIAAVYERAAELRGITLEEMQEMVARNVRRCFGW